MSLKTASLLIMLASYVLLVMSTMHGLRLARKAHGVSLRDVKNEVPGGYALRAGCSLVYYFCIADWALGTRLAPFAFWPYNAAMNIAGLVLLSLVVALFWAIHLALGANYHGPMKLHDDHRLVTGGPYAFARHPTYLAFPLLHLAFSLVTGSWLLLLAGLLMSVPLNRRRIEVEEGLLLERFGDGYRGYMERTGRYFPRLRRPKSSA